MNRHSFRSVSSSAVLASLFLLAAAPGRAATLHVFLIGGQSNANGHAVGAELPAELQAPREGVYYYYGSNGVVPVLGPLAPRQTFGPEVTFGRALAEFYKASGEKVALLQYAVGGSNLYNHWKVGPPEGVLYKNFKAHVASGLEALKQAEPSATPVIEGMVWMQGEADGGAADKDAYERYEDHLEALVRDVRSHYGADLPFVFGRLSSRQTSVGAHLEDIRRAQDAVASSVKGTKLVDTDGFELFGDHLHFDARGQQALGEAFAKAMEDMIPAPASAPANGN